MKLKRVALSILTALTFSLPLQAASTNSGAKVDYDAAGKEATKILCDYLKVDTTNPPGNEKLGADFLADIIRKEGLEATVVDLGKNRSLVCS